MARTPGVSPVETPLNDLSFKNSSTGSTRRNKQADLSIYGNNESDDEIK